MKIDRSKSKKSSSDVPFDCKLLIEELKSCDEEKLLVVLKRIRTWNCGKCELYHWIDVLDIFDSILEECCCKESPDQWTLPVDLPQNAKKRELLLAIISFTALLIEHSFSRHLYNSIEHLITLLSSTDMQIVLAILNLLFVFSKRSNFFARINFEKRQPLLSRLYYLAVNWGGKDQGFSLAKCCQDLPLSCFPSSATNFNFNFELYLNNEDTSNKNGIVRINIENVHLIDKTISQMMAEIVEKYQIKDDETQMQIFTQLRLAKNFPNYQTRLQCVQARLNAISILVYCQTIAPQDIYKLLHIDLIEELVEILELRIPELIEIKSASLKTLTSIIHLDRNSKLKAIIESTGANSYHGFLPIVVRNCISSLISGCMQEYPLNFVTALFSFLYHLASYEAGCDALVQCGIMESLLSVVDWKGPEPDHITFVTRAVRVIDLLTSQFIDVNSFRSNNGLNIFVQRLEYEVNICRKEQPYEIKVPEDKIDNEQNSVVDDEEIEEESGVKKESELSETPMEVEVESEPVASTSHSTSSKTSASASNGNLMCYPQRAALLKSMLNFLKRAVQGTEFTEVVRPLMYGNFPRSLRHIISNAEYYGSSLFLLATDVVSVYVYQEPSLLSVIQDNGLSEVVLHAILVKNIPPTKEVIASLPTVFTSLCLNHRGLNSFLALNPFERLFKIFLSPDYLQAMRRRRSESITDTATCLGNAIDELMRHQPTLKCVAISSIVELLENLCALGKDPKYICTKANKTSETPSINYSESNSRNITSSNVNNDSSSSGEDDDYDDDTPTTTAEPSNTNNSLIIPSNSEDSNVSMKHAINNRSEQNRQQIPLLDYILNVMRFLDAILSNNSTDDHCQEFLKQNGLQPLYMLLELPNLPADFPITTSCLAVANVFKSILNLSHERAIFSQGFQKLKEILEKLSPLYQAETFNGSIILEDLINHLSSKKSNVSSQFVSPFAQSIVAAHSYVMLFNFISRTSNAEIRTIAVDHWGSKLGSEIIKLLSNLYIALVWESTLLLGLNDATPPRHEFIKEQTDKLNNLLKNTTDNDNAMSPMEVDVDNDSVCSNCGNCVEKKAKALISNRTHQKYVKPLLNVASKLGRSLAELFGVLVKLSVGSSNRRRGHHSAPFYMNGPPNFVPSRAAQNICKGLNVLLCKGLSWHPSPITNLPKFRLTFYICSIGFSSPILFDDRNSPYYLMLKNFELQGGLDAFFECFEMIFDPNLTCKELNGAMIEFLDSWLLLLEKLINPQMLFESPHTYTMTPSVTDSPIEKMKFDPMQYLIQIHKKAYPCIMRLWLNKLYEIKFDRIIESLLTILSHILKGEKIINKHLAKQASPSTAASSSALSSSSPSTVNPYVQTLIDMGFSPEIAAESVLNAGEDINAAAEWILQHSLFGQDEDVVQAIALSLSELEEAKEKTSTESKNKEVASVNEVPIKKEDLDSFTEKILGGILLLVDKLPEIIHSCCELLISISKRNDKKWFIQTINELIADIIANMTNINEQTSYIQNQSSISKSPVDWEIYLSKSADATKLTSKVHLLVLLFNRTRDICATLINNSTLLNLSIELVENASYILNLAHTIDPTITTPKWLAPLILLIDLYEKNALTSRRRQQLLLDTADCKRTWKFFDERSSRWCSYQHETSKAIDEAFRNGENYCHIQVARRKYTVNFSGMVQASDETYSCKAVMFFIDNDKSNDKEKSSKTEKEVKTEQENEQTDSKTPKVENVDQKKPAEKISNDIEIDFIDPKQCKTLIESMINLAQLPIDPNALNSILRLCLRLTRNYENAIFFIEKNGINTLLKIPAASVFPGFVPLAKMIIRHTLEDKQIMRAAMDKAIRQEFSPASSGREMHYLFRLFTPAACRDIDAFKESAMNILRINVLSMAGQRRLVNEDRLTSLRVVQNRGSEQHYEIPKITRDIVCELLNILPVKYNEEFKNPQQKNKKPDDKENDKKNDLFHAHNILSLLTELTQSYNFVARIICEHIYSIGVVDPHLEECSAISFILDNLLPFYKSHGDKDLSKYSLQLFTNIATVPFLMEVHHTLISEIKNALSRAVLLPESIEKHAKIQALASLTASIVEIQFIQPILQRAQINPSPNLLVKYLIRKNLIGDFAKVIQSLDLSSSMFVVTGNILLKTLEFLSKNFNQPTSHPLFLKNNQNMRNRRDMNIEFINAELGSTMRLVNEAIMEHEQSENLTNSVNNQESSQVNQTASQNTNAINEEINASTISNTLDNSNVDENTENELFLDSVAYDYNSHPRSGTFTSDEHRTDDDDDDQNAMADASDPNEIHDNVANSNCVESTSSDTDSSDSEEDSDDVDELEEEDDDDPEAAGSTQDEPDEEDDEDEPIEGDEDFIDGEVAVQALFDDIYEDSSDFLFNLEDVLPQVLHIREAFLPYDASTYIVPFTTPSGENPLDNPSAFNSGSNNVQVHHPLLINASERANNSSNNNGSSSSSNSNSQLNSSTRWTRMPRNRVLRSYLQANSWQVARILSRYPPSHLQRLVGTSSSHVDLPNVTRNSLSRRHGADREFDLDVYIDNTPGSVALRSIGSAIKSTMSRWLDESRILDGGYMFDPILLTKPEIIKHLEKIREEEIPERKKKDKETETPKSSSSNRNNISPETMIHIEQLTNSVINQVFEYNSLPGSSTGNTQNTSTNPPVEEGSVASNANANETAESFENNNNVESANNEANGSQMEVVSDEHSEQPMAVSHSTPVANLVSETSESQQDIEFNPIAPTQQEQNSQPQQPETQSQSAPQEQAASTSNPTTTYEMTPEERAILGDQELPEGVDPSFLAALPENIRQEVIVEQLRLQRSRNQQQQQPSNMSVVGSSNVTPMHYTEVNPEFLAALPLSLQEEVLAQQRAEQQRLNAQNADRDSPIDPALFLSSLAPSLRRQVLTDMDDSQIQILPPDLANEARTLRREFEMRSRSGQDRLLSYSSPLTHIMRSGRLHYETMRLPHLPIGFRIRSSSRSHDSQNNYLNYSRFMRPSNSRASKGKQLLDHEALSSVLILLFINNTALHQVRLHRLIKNLCYHPPTRQWIIQWLLEIMEKTKDSVDQDPSDSNFVDDQTIRSLTHNNFVSWLSITLDSSFGARTNVFYLYKSNSQANSSKKCSNNYTISINPKASLFVCRNVLDVLISLAKFFPEQLFSSSMPNLQKNQSTSSLNNSSGKDCHDSNITKPAPNFFDILMRHDFIHVSKKTKSKQANTSLPTPENDSSKNLDSSPFSQLLNLLSHHFVKKSPMLTDRLVRLMAHIAESLTHDSERNQSSANLSTEIKDKLNEIETTIANERLLKLVVDVLVSRCCSEEGLNDVNNLLVKLSDLFPKCRSIFYKYLLGGVISLGETLYYDIKVLTDEMKELLESMKNEATQNDEQQERLIKGQTSIQDRYSNMTIVINAQSNVKHISGREIRLPSMSHLISKSSSQLLFLRILRIIGHIRSNAKNTKTNENSSEKMEVDSEDKLSSELHLDHLWEKLSECLSLLSQAPDEHVVLVLQPAVESFFLVHAPEKDKSSTRYENGAQQVSHLQTSSELTGSDANNDSDNRQYNSLPADTEKFLLFAEKHRVVLNQILRQSKIHLAVGPFAVLVDHTRILDFDVKRRYFRRELELSDRGTRREDLPVHIRREHVFEDSYRELNRRTLDEWKNRFYIVFEGEEGQDAGGLLREWYTIISREIFNPNYALFTTSPGDRVTYMINSASHCNSNHLSYFKFVGRVISKAIHDNKLLDCYFTRSFYKHILGKAVKYTDMESEDYAFYQGLVFLLEHNVNELGTELTFSLEIQEFGVTEVRDLKPNGRNIIVTEENKHEYVKLVCQEKMTGSIKKQLQSFLEGFYEIIPKRLISIFNEHELELLISGLPNIDIDDLKANTDYNKYQANSLQIQWFWRALRTFDQADRAKFLQFVTGTSKVPLQGFSALEGMNGPQKFQIHLDDRSTDRLPSAHTCFNQLDLPVYETYDKLRSMLLKAIHECSEGFGFA